MFEPCRAVLVGHQAVHLRTSEQEPPLDHLDHLSERFMIAAEKRTLQNTFHQGSLRCRQSVQLGDHRSNLAGMLDLEAIRQPFQAAGPDRLDLWNGAAAWN